MRIKWILLALPLMLTGCLDDDSLEQNNTFVGNFEACWRAMDEHYCFFEEKGVDWDQVYRDYLPLFRDSVKNQIEEFNLMAAMLSEVRDGHVNLYSPFNTARYWAWFEDYPLNYDANLVERYYLGKKYYSTSGFQYGVMSDSVAYMRYPSFSSPVGETNLDYILALLHNAKGLIIDVRDNGGGTLTNVPTIVRRFCTNPLVYGYMCHKTGTGHRDFSTPQKLTVYPYEENNGRINWDASVQPVVVLTNRGCYSATNNFVAAIKALDGDVTKDSIGVSYPKMIKTLGDRTGGGGGMPLETVLPNGWILRFSACPILDHNKNQVEEGIDPDFKVDMDSVSMYEKHVDDIIDSARAYIKLNTRKVYPTKKSD